MVDGQHSNVMRTKNKKPIVYIVHAVDVEGPMTETLQATFERMYSLGLSKMIRPSSENLKLIQGGRLSGLSFQLAVNFKKIFNKRSLSYLTSWQAIDPIIQEITSKKFRLKHSSKDGSPYVLSWFIYDHHEGFSDNPRFHEVGTHKIFDHYHHIFRNNKFNDGNYWHYHHPSMNGHALESNTCWSNRPIHEEIIARRIIERLWYFGVFRAGLHIERNDISHWLEMFFPFDFSARFDEKGDKTYMPGGDFDWRGCPSRWGGWHPDWYDYRKKGNMRRWLFRCTDLATYLNRLKQEEVDEAFNQAVKYGNSVLTYYNHDYRDMRIEINEGYDVIVQVSKKYPQVDWKFVNALQAAQRHLSIKSQKPRLTYKLKGNTLVVNSNIPIFGPQPFLAIQEGDRFFRDNFTDEGNLTWIYKFRNFKHVKAFGIAANSPSGEYDLAVKRF